MGQYFFYLYFTCSSWSISEDSCVPSIYCLIHQWFTALQVDVELIRLWTEHILKPAKVVLNISRINPCHFHSSYYVVYPHYLYLRKWKDSHPVNMV